MARARDWLDLGKSTLSSLTQTNVAGLYSQEWPETKDRLIAEHRELIDREPKRVKRYFRTVSAITFGLTKRLAPHRRVLFVLCVLSFFASLMAIFAKMNNPPLLNFFEVGATFVVVTLLLAMELIDKLKYRDELALARDLQASLIPRDMPRAEPWDIAAFNDIANTVGGDIYDFVPLADGRLAVLFGDASGHGMAAGLVMAVAHAAFRTQLDIDPSPGAIIASLNRILCRTGGSRSFFSACYLLMSTDGAFSATLAGHPPILHVSRAGKLLERIGRGAYPLGVKSGLAWPSIEGKLELGERLVLHSDGLTESRNANEREFGDTYVEAIVGWHPDTTSAMLVETIVGEWKLFRGDKPSEDDVSIAVITRSH